MTAVQEAGEGDFLWVHLALLLHLASWGLFLVPKGAAAISRPRLEPQRSQKQTRAPRGTWADTMLCLCKQPVPLRGQW